MKTFIDQHDATGELNLTETAEGVLIEIYGGSTNEVALSPTDCLALAAALIEYAGA